MVPTISQRHTTFFMTGEHIIDTMHFNALSVHYFLTTVQNGDTIIISAFIIHSFTRLVDSIRKLVTEMVASVFAHVVTAVSEIMRPNSEYMQLAQEVI